MITVHWKERDRVGEDNAFLRQRIVAQENAVLRQRAAELDASAQESVASSEGVPEKNAGIVSDDIAVQLQEHLAQLCARVAQVIAIAEENGALHLDLEARMREAEDLRAQLAALQNEPKGSSVMRWLKSLFKARQ